MLNLVPKEVSHGEGFERRSGRAPRGEVGQGGGARSVLAGAEPLARAEAFTPAWFALRTAKDVFWIVDTFANAEDRQRHIDGEIANALRAKAPELLAEPPSIHQADVLGEKLAQNVV